MKLGVNDNQFFFRSSNVVCPLVVKHKQSIAMSFNFLSAVQYSSMDDEFAALCCNGNLHFYEVGHDIGCCGNTTVNYTTSDCCSAKVISDNQGCCQGRTFIVLIAFPHMYKMQICMFLLWILFCVCSDLVLNNWLKVLKALLAVSGIICLTEILGLASSL